jgi:hypothetical protein
MCVGIKLHIQTCDPKIHGYHGPVAHTQLGLMVIMPTQNSTQHISSPTLALNSCETKREGAVPSVKSPRVSISIHRSINPIKASRIPSTRSSFMFHTQISFENTVMGHVICVSTHCPNLYGYVSESQIHSIATHNTNPHQSFSPINQVQIPKQSVIHVSRP